MKRLGLIVGFVLVVWMGSAGAEDAALNDPPGFTDKVKAVVNALNPSYETIWDFDAGEFTQGVSAALYTVTSSEIPVGSLRLGFGTNEKLYGGVATDLPGIARRWLPATVKGIATKAPLDALWAVAGKYARLSLIGGYGFAEEEPVYGIAVGAALSF